MKSNKKKEELQLELPKTHLGGSLRSRGAPNADLGGALGNATKLRTPSHIDKDTGECLFLGKIPENELISQARKVRFELQDQARKILYSYYGKDVPVNAKGYEVHHRTCTCNRFRSKGNAQVVKSKTNSKAFFTGVTTCANSRTCPVCSAKISERKSNEMRTAFNIALAEKLNISLLTFTAPHTAGDKVDDLKNKISDALSRFWRGATAKRFKEKYGIIGNIRSFEIRHGSNGWHPHFHIIIFSNSNLPSTKKSTTGKTLPRGYQLDDWQKILDRWIGCCLKAGLNSPNEFGLDIQDGSNAGEYISKFGSDDEFLHTKTGKKITWDMADELTKGNVKTGRKGSLSPWEILSYSIESDSEKERKKYTHLFLDYARATQGTSLIKWSRGLRDYFQLGKELSDEEIIKLEEDKADILCQITPNEWNYIIKNNLRTIVLELAENGGSQAIARLLYVDNYQTFDEYFEEFSNRNNNHFDEVPSPNLETSFKQIKSGLLKVPKNHYADNLIRRDSTQKPIRQHLEKFEMARAEKARSIRDRILKYHAIKKGE